MALSLLLGIDNFVANPNTVGQQKESALMLAAAYSHLLVVQYLFGLQNSQTHGWQDPTNGVGLAQNSLRFSAEPDPRSTLESSALLARNSSGRTALHIALSKRKIEICWFLLENGPAQTDPKIASVTPYW